MGQTHTPSLIELLKKTLQHLENTEGLDRTDTAYLELTRHVTRAIAELEVAKSERTTAA